MSIQTISKSPSTDGLSVKSQSRDLEMTAPVPFDEVLKDEEKRLQEEREVSASSVAAVLSAMQPKAASIPVTPVQVTEEGGEIGNPDGLRPPVLQPITAQPPVNGLSSQAVGTSNSVENQASTVGNQPDAAQMQANQSFADDLSTQVGKEMIVAESAQEVPQSNLNAVGSGEVSPAITNLDPAADQGVILDETNNNLKDAKLDSVKTSDAAESKPAATSEIPQSTLNAVADQKVISDETNKSTKDVKLDSVKTSETASLDQPAIQPVGTAKAQPDQEELLSGQKRSEGEEPIPSAKEQEPVLKFEGMTMASAPDMDTPLLREAGKFSITDINVQTTEVIRQIMSQMKVKMKGDATSMRLLLNPKELGEIEVRMIRNTEGVSVTFFAEQANTARMLETQMNQLRQSLKDAGVQLTDLNFSQHDQPKQEGGFLRQGPQFNQYLSSVAPQTEIVNKVLERPERIDGLLNEVDYLI
jgi:flagellar hook-length control protein FliK